MNFILNLIIAVLVGVFLYSETNMYSVAYAAFSLMAILAEIADTLKSKK